MKMSQVFPSKYVKAVDLGGKTVTLTMKAVKVEEMGHGSEKERKPVLYFEKATKGLVLNRTNAMIIAGMYGDESDEWGGKRISIYPTTVRAFGGTHETIRVKEEIPAQPKPQVATADIEEPHELDDIEDMVDPDYDPDLFEQPHSAA